MAEFALDVLIVTLASGPIACLVLWVGTVISILLTQPESFSSMWLSLAGLGVLAPLCGFIGSIGLFPVTVPFGMLIVIILRILGGKARKPSRISRFVSIVAGFCYGPLACVIIFPAWYYIMDVYRNPLEITLRLIIIAAVIGSIAGLFLPWRLISPWRPEVSGPPPPPMPT